MAKKQEVNTEKAKAFTEFMGFSGSYQQMESDHEAFKDPARKRYEFLDSTPMAPPIGYQKQPSMIDHVRSMVHHELWRRRQDEEFETLEESEDFGPDGDYDPSSPYEYDEDNVTIAELKARHNAALAKAADLKAAMEAAAGRPDSSASPPEPRPSPNEGARAPSGPAEGLPAGERSKER